MCICRIVDHLAPGGGGIIYIYKYMKHAGDRALSLHYHGGKGRKVHGERFCPSF